MNNKYFDLVLASQSSLEEIQKMLSNFTPAIEIKGRIIEVMGFLAQCYELNPTQENKDRLQQCKTILIETLMQLKIYDVSTKHKPNEIIVSPCNKVMLTRTFTDEHYDTCKVCKEKL